MVSLGTGFECFVGWVIKVSGRKQKRGLDEKRCNLAQIKSRQHDAGGHQ